MGGGFILVHYDPAPDPVYRRLFLTGAALGRYRDPALKASSLFGDNPARLCAVTAGARRKQAGLGAKS